jgi:hypothetical protein
MSAIPAPRKRANATRAGLASLLAAMLPLGLWIILIGAALPTHGPPLQGAFNAMRYLVSAKSPGQSLFIWMAVAPAISLAIGAAYLFGLARSRRAAGMLFALTVALGVSGLFVTHGITLGALALLPAVWGWAGLREAAPRPGSLPERSP